ncbi:MAG: AraC family transcriptional regulator [Lachnospiraceae bacterium]|nr:AraC family transcriptional regulator [Lachnospiraceae bacterium]
MQVYKVETDESLQSVLEYGTPEFPFMYYYDEINRYHEKSVEWHWHNELELSFVVAGPVECYVGKEKVELQSGDALFVNQGIIHRFASGSGAVMVHYVFGSEFISPFGSRIHTQYVLPVLVSSLLLKKIEGESAEGQSILKNMIRMHSELEIQAEAWELRVKNCMLHVWNDLYGMLKEELLSLSGNKTKNDNRTYARIRKMLNYIHRNYGEEMTLEEIAESADISKSEALRCFKAGLQTTPMAYLTQYRLNCAKDLLQKGQDSVQKIALKCGFDNSSYFCKVFKKHLGISPLEFCEVYADENLKI